MRKWKMGLCEGRHEIPMVTDGYIFTEELSPEDISNPGRLEFMAADAILDKCVEICPEKYMDLSGIRMDLYVTGLTIALIAALNICREEGIKVTLWHFNRETGKYYPQEVR